MGQEVDFSDFDEAKWYSAARLIRNYEVTGAKRVFQSKNLRRELYLGTRLAGQFQHPDLIYWHERNTRGGNGFGSENRKSSQVLFI